MRRELLAAAKYADLTPLADVVEQEIAEQGPFGPFHRFWLLKRAPNKVREYLELGARRPYFQAIRQGFASMDTNDVNTAAFGARNTSAAELNILQDGTTGASAATSQAIINQFCAIPPNDARAGKVYEVRAGGIYSNTGTPTVIVTPRWGTLTTVATNVTLGAGPTWTSITATTNLPWRIWFEMAIRTSPPGATQGTGYGLGTVHMGTPVTSSEFVLTLYIGGTAATIDTTGQGTAGCGLTMNWTWSVSSASNTLTTQYWILRSLN